MKTIKKALTGWGWKGQAAIVAMLLAASFVQSQAQVTNLTSGSTSLQITLGGPNAGLSDWLVGGVNQLGYQWLYYSVGASAVSSIDTISPFTAPTFVNAQPNPFLTETYANSTLSVKTTYQLQGSSSASGSAGLQTTINLQNLSGSTQTFHLYQYSDFDLGGVLGNQTVQFAGTGMPYQVTQTGPVGSGPLKGSISALGATVEEIAGIEGTNLLGLFPGSQAPTYNDSSLTAGPGDVAYAYEIDITLSANQSLTVSELQTVPEPSTMALIFVGTLSFGVCYGRKLVSFKKAVKNTSL